MTDPHPTQYQKNEDEYVKEIRARLAVLEEVKACYTEEEYKKAMKDIIIGNKTESTKVGNGSESDPAGILAARLRDDDLKKKEKWRTSFEHYQERWKAYDMSEDDVKSLKQSILDRSKRGGMEPIMVVWAHVLFFEADPLKEARRLFEMFFTEPHHEVLKSHNWRIFDLTKGKYRTKGAIIEQLPVPLHTPEAQVVNDELLRDISVETTYEGGAAPLEVGKFFKTNKEKSVFTGGGYIPVLDASGTQQYVADTTALEGAFGQSMQQMADNLISRGFTIRKANGKPYQPSSEYYSRGRGRGRGAARGRGVYNGGALHDSEGYRPAGDDTEPRQDPKNATGPGA